MAVSVDDRQFHGLRWLTLRGPRDELFVTLGAAAADDVHAVLESMPEANALRSFAGSSGGRRLVDGILDRTRERYGRELQEALDIAAGARYDVDALLLANLRGDIGGADSLGCTDLGYVGRDAIVAHNEDGAPALLGRLMLVTLAVDGEVPVTVQWYPGFLPSNTFVVTGHGLAWGIDHLPVETPAMAPGRQFVARALQHQPNLDAAVHFLERHPSAGGFAYTIGEFGSGRVVTVESAAGKVASIEASAPEQPLLWHTNHTRFLAQPRTEAVGPSPRADRVAGHLGQIEESRARGELLEGLATAAGRAGVDWCLETLADNVAPHGVFRSAEGSDPLMTLCTTVVDLHERNVTVQPRGQRTTTLPAEAYTAGSP